MIATRLWAGVFLIAATVSAAADEIQPIDATRCAHMQARAVIGPDAPIPCARLRSVRFSYYGFDDRLHDDGDVVVMDALAPHVARIFATLKARHFPIAKAVPIEAYAGEDAASMADDNTSSFNDRRVEGSDRLSLHAYGAAIDINPVENPFLTFRGNTIAVAPTQAAAFVNRREPRPGKPNRPGMAEAVVDVFAENGFVVWGGNWDSPIDYQHFDIGRTLAEELTRLSPEKAAARFALSLRRTDLPPGK